VNGGHKQGAGNTLEQGVATAPRFAGTTPFRLVEQPSIEVPVQAMAVQSMQNLQDEELGDDGHRANGRDQELRQEHGPEEKCDGPPAVTVNSPHPPWDDNSFPDQPYQNPYYTLPTRDVLWLPVNPIGTLDLDMTVTMNVALAREPEAGSFGPLTERGNVFPGLAGDLESTGSVPGDGTSVNGPPLEGAEEIEPTPTAASTTDQQLDLFRTDPPTRRTTGLPTQSAVLREAFDEEKKALQTQQKREAEERMPRGHGGLRGPSGLQESRMKLRQIIAPHPPTSNSTPSLPPSVYLPRTTHIHSSYALIFALGLSLCRMCWFYPCVFIYHPLLYHSPCRTYQTRITRNLIALHLVPGLYCEPPRQCYVLALAARVRPQPLQSVGTVKLLVGTDTW